MRTHGWAGDPPADDDEAIRRILDATRACIDRTGDASISSVSVALGVSRQTVYRYFAGTEVLIAATALDAVAGVHERIIDHLGTEPLDPAEAVVEYVAYTLELLPEEPYLRLLLEPSGRSIVSQGFTSPPALTLGRALIDTMPVDWSSLGWDDPQLDELVEHVLRLIQSFAIDPGRPPRTGVELRAYLTRWLSPTLATPRGSRDVGTR
ncbi:MAG: TetR/AcrR family transcriptional regulator [Actinobacteria bacterium]|nr:TetR/AcrR family transcriptional regulator [Actinomycetota bacterium]